MTADCLRPMTMDLPEWRRSGRFFLIAAALHGAALAYPLKVAIGEPEPPPLRVTLARPEVPTPLPVAEPSPKPRPAQPAVVAKPEKATPKPARVEAPPRPLLAMPAEPSAPPAGPTVAVAAPAPEAPAKAVATAATAPAPFSAARFDAAYLQNPKANYPPLSRRLGEEGKVLLRVRVTAEGLPATVDLEKSSNSERLDAAARRAVARWRFVPAKRGDEAVESSVIVPVVFRLES